MYSNSHSRVKCKHVLSKSITISQGVHQGSELSPLLFNIFIINDFEDAMSEQDAPLLLDHRITHLLYIDDLLLLSTTPKGLQYNIDKVNEFCNNWGLSVNVDKSRL